LFCLCGLLRRRCGLKAIPFRGWRGSRFHRRCLRRRHYRLRGCCLLLCLLPLFARLHGRQRRLSRKPQRRLPFALPLSRR
jgi:hypothetical protein